MTAAPDVETAPDWGTPELDGMQPVEPDESFLEELADDIRDGFREVVVNGRSLLIGAGEAVGAGGMTAFAAGGPAGLAVAGGVAAVAGGTAIVARRAHAKEKAAQEGKPDPKATAKALKNAERVQKQAAKRSTAANRAAGRSGPGRHSNTRNGLPGLAGIGRGAGGRGASSRGLGSPSRGGRKATGFTMPKPSSGKAGGSGASRGAAGTGKSPAGKGVSALRSGKPVSPLSKGAPSSPAGKGASKTATPGKSGLPSLPKGKSTTASGHAGIGKSAGRGASRPGLFSRSGGGGRGSLFGGGRSGGASGSRSGSKNGGRSGGSSGSKGGFGTSSRGVGSHRTARGPIGRLTKSLGGKHASGRKGTTAGKGSHGQAAKSSRLGRATQAVAGSKAGRAAGWAGRKAGAGIRRSGGAAKRGYQTGRAAIAGAAKAKGGTPKQIAQAARTAAARKQAQHAKATGKKVGRIGKLRRRMSRAAIGLGASGGVRAGRRIRSGGIKAAWILALLTAWARSQPLPLRPDIARAAMKAQAAQHAAANPTIATDFNGPDTVWPELGGNKPMAHFGDALKGLADQAVGLASEYIPEGMLEWGSDMEALEGFLEAIAQVIEAVGRGAENLPIEQTVKNTIPPVVSVQMSAASASREIANMFNIVHEKDLERLRNPRAGEEKWDLTNNQRVG